MNIKETDFDRQNIYIYILFLFHYVNGDDDDAGFVGLLN